jgi:hypothetical protein
MVTKITTRMDTTHEFEILSKMGSFVIFFAFIFLFHKGPVSALAVLFMVPSLLYFVGHLFTYNPDLASLLCAWSSSLSLISWPSVIQRLFSQIVYFTGNVIVHTQSLPKVSVYHCFVVAMDWMSDQSMIIHPKAISHLLQLMFLVGFCFMEVSTPGNRNTFHDDKLFDNNAYIAPLILWSSSSGYTSNRNSNSLWESVVYISFPLCFGPE